MGEEQVEPSEFQLHRKTKPENRVGINKVVLPSYFSSQQNEFRVQFELKILEANHQGTAGKG